MSHNVTMKLSLRDLQSLITAGEIRGLDFHQNAHTFKSYTTGQCTHKFSVKGNRNAFELGIIAEKDGSYSFSFDPWNNGNGLIDVIGHNGELLLDEYNIVRTKNEAMAQGYMQFEDGVTADGRRYVDVIVAQ